MFRAGAPLAFALVAGACGDPFEPEVEVGYGFAYPGEADVVYRWPIGSTVRVHVAGGDSARAELLTDALVAAAADWEAAVGEGRVRIQAVPRVEEADVVLRWSDVEPPVDVSGCPPRVTGRATTTFCWTVDRRGIRAFPLDPEAGTEASGVRMLVTVLAEEGRSAARVRQLVAHELGHVLGIGQHSPDPADLMWEGPLRAMRPSSADRATIQRLYETVPDVVP